MQKLAKFTAIVSFLALLFSLGGLPLPAAAAENPPVSGASGPFTVTNLAVDKGSWRVEAFKVDGSLVAWTETSAADGARRLFVFDGVTVKQLAEMKLDEWNDDGAFYDPVLGNFDVADGLVVWTQSDGSDREIWSYDGTATSRVSDNTYDDRHPIVSRGRIAWTSSPGSAYNLMVKEPSGSLRRLASYDVLNYAFSGPNLFWLNRLPNENWFRVFRDDGRYTLAVGQGDDRALPKYFYVDGQGSAAWEYSTKQWAYDKRVIYVSENGAAARTVIQRDVPPNITYLEAVKGGEVLLNSKDLLTNILDNTQLIMSNGFSSKVVVRKPAPSKALFVYGGIIRHLEPYTSTPLVFNGGNGGEDYISLDHVILDLFDADGDLAAGALLKGGVVAFLRGQTYDLPTASTVRAIAVKGGGIAWIDGETGHSVLQTAAETVLASSAGNIRSVSGRLIKVAGRPQVYLAASDGKRYLFPGEGEYRAWYQDFTSVQTVPAQTLASLPLAGNIIYRPGSRLLKAASSPRIYSVGVGGKLHYMANAAVLAQAYGQDWNLQVDIIPDVRLGDYPAGAAVVDPNRYALALNQ